MDADGSAAGLSLKEYENCLPPMTGVLGHSLSIPAPDFLARSPGVLDGVTFRVHPFSMHSCRLLIDKATR